MDDSTPAQAVTSGVSASASVVPQSGLTAPSVDIQPHPTITGAWQLTVDSKTPQANSATWVIQVTFTKTGFSNDNLVSIPR
jgi:hypothetical protein